ncbi:amidase [Methylosinus sp. Sm6]|uniref:amidase n=1 Tax=Methylosinus sp. Sm6 TaxID=2866948 RepID=UPI001C99A162|nr:amidase [Methylosinus sp. Sm6]MBY6241236.1 amidase [Methylosinus sp. Sm6]
MSGPSSALTRALDVSRSARGALSGERFVVKENIDVAGCVSTNGNPRWAETHEAAAQDAPAVDRLLAAGARLVGKAQMDEMAYSLLGANVHYGTPVNPAAPDRHPGGSSSGSAVAVAAGLADFALGTDTAGSCRAPASFCGVYGFRPSHGAVSPDGVIPLAQSLDTIGWFARDVETLARVGEILLPEDVSVGTFERAVALEEAFAQSDEEAKAAARPARAALARMFAVDEATLGEDFWSQALRHFRNLQAFEAWSAQGPWIEREAPRFGPGIAERFAYAAQVTAGEKAEADAFRRAARARVDAILPGNTLLVVPTTPFVSPRLDESEAELDAKRYRMFRTFLFASFFGLPQISVPPPRAPGAPPLGVSLIGPRWSDRRLIEAASLLAASL